MRTYQQQANANCGPRSSNFFCSRFGPCSKKKWVGSVMLFRSRHGHRCIHDSSRCGFVHLFHSGWKSALLPFWIPVREFFPPDLPILSRQCQYGNPMGLGLLRSQYANGCKRISDELWQAEVGRFKTNKIGNLMQVVFHVSQYADCPIS